MINKKLFYDNYRKLYGSFSVATLETLEAMLEEFNSDPIPDIKPVEKYAYMFATVRHECGAKMLPIVENMNYSAARMMQVWSSRFPTLSSARPYAHNPEALGNNVYANRLGNGNAASGDGYKYRGRGIGAQFTGKVNYIKFSKLFNVDLVNNPDLALDVELGAKVLKRGCIEGLFTGFSLSKYINNEKIDYINARRVVNADVARVGKSIAADAVKFENIIRKSWRIVGAAEQDIVTNEVKTTDKWYEIIAKKILGR